jgi:hypothetical protein
MTANSFQSHQSALEMVGLYTFTSGEETLNVDLMTIPVVSLMLVKRYTRMCLFSADEFEIALSYSDSLKAFRAN